VLSPVTLLVYWVGIKNSQKAGIHLEIGVLLDGGGLTEDKRQKLKLRVFNMRVINYCFAV
jgi:hypothetical protein